MRLCLISLISHIEFGVYGKKNKKKVCAYFRMSDFQFSLGCFFIIQLLQFQLQLRYQLQLCQLLLVQLLRFLLLVLLR